MSAPLAGEGMLPSTTVYASAVSVSTMRLENPDEASNFVRDHSSSLLQLRAVFPFGGEILRYIDTRKTLSSDSALLHFYPQAAPNFGDVDPALLSSLAVELTVADAATDLFTSPFVFSVAKETARVEAVRKIANAYLSEESDRIASIESARMCLRWMNGEDFTPDADGHMPWESELKQIIAGYPQSYAFSPSLADLAHVVSLQSEGEYDLEEIQFDESTDGVKIPVTFIGKQHTLELDISVHRLREFAKPIIPWRRYETGHAYPLEGFYPYGFFWLPGHTIQAVSIQRLVRRFRSDETADFLIELVSYDGEVSTCTTMDEVDTFLLLPLHETDEPMFLACPEVVDPAGEVISASYAGATAFGVVQINVLKL